MPIRVPANLIGRRTIVGATTVLPFTWMLLSALHRTGANSRRLRASVPLRVRSSDPTFLGESQVIPARGCQSTRPRLHRSVIHVKGMRHQVHAIERLKIAELTNAHTRINITPTILSKKIEESRAMGALCS